jgi:SpoVK/Ycf46/Vps4 family AAA+-type ATPase
MYVARRLQADTSLERRGESSCLRPGASYVLVHTTHDELFDHHVHFYISKPPSLFIEWDYENRMRLGNNFRSNMCDHVSPPNPLPGTMENEVQALKQLVSQLLWTLDNKTRSDTPSESSVGVGEEKGSQMQVFEIEIPEDALGVEYFSESLLDATDKAIGVDDIEKMDLDVEVRNTVEEGMVQAADINQHLVPRGSSLTSQDIRCLLKALRQQLEVHYETVQGGIPRDIISAFASFESSLNLHRDPTTSSIWNDTHQLHRFEDFSPSSVGVLYREKCVCNPGIPHKNDIHCPRNIVDDLTTTHEDTQSTKSGDEQEEEEPFIEETPEQIAEREAAAKKEREEELAATVATAIASIEAMTGLRELKAHVAKLKSRVETARRQGADIKDDRFGTVFIGNSGTGKTTVAKHYAGLLQGLGVVGSNNLKETTAIYLSDGGIDRTRRYIEALEGTGGVFFVDGAHNFVNGNHSRGKKVLDFIIEEIERTRGKVVFLFAGLEDGMTKILGSGSGVAGMLPNIVRFKDLEDDELRRVLWDDIKKKGSEKVEVEGGEDGLFMRVAARRLGRGRASLDFGNARAVENLCARIWERQAARLSESRKLAAEQKDALEKSKEKARGDEIASLDSVLTDPSEALDQTGELKPGEKQNDSPLTPDEVGTTKETVDISHPKTTEDQNIKNVELNTDTKNNDTIEDAGIDTIEGKEGNDEGSLSVDPEDYKLTKEDLLGVDPSNAVLDSPAWTKLQSLTGMKSVKESILSLLELVKTNYIRELEEKPLLKVSLNRLFLGPPGTGKTLVAKLYAQLLTEIGALSKGEVIMRTPADLIGKYIGHSEANTKAALTAAMGNVLVIDEAYMMYSSSADGTGSKTDSFRQGIVDTLVGEIQSEPGEDRCVLLLGYDVPMQEMLQNSNPGLARRFPISDAFWFHDFNEAELESILRSKLKEGVLEATEDAIKVAMDTLEKARSRVNFGNGGDIENLISKAKINFQKRVSALPVLQRPQTWIFEPQDFDPEYDRAKSATENLRELFSDVIGCDDVVTRLERYQRVCQTLKKRNMDPRAFIPTNFVFKGPPGTGKTTTARKIAKVYYDMGFLADPSVVECSASDLVGKYVGHSGPKTRKVFERGLGKVLFIDEAYRLANGNSSCGTGSFNAEVVAELVDLLTKPAFSGKLIVILAGYEKEMNQLLGMNPGLASRFPEEIHFASLDPLKCIEILKMKLAKSGISAPVLEEKEGQMFENIISLLRFLAKTPGWGSARDMETLAKSLARDVFAAFDGQSQELICEGPLIAAAMDIMLQERRARKTTR